MPEIELPPQIPNDVRGWLTFSAPLPDDLQRAEDATQHRDTYTPDHPVYSQRHRKWFWIRPATETERILLSHLGYDVPEKLDTFVEFKTDTLRRRFWPALEYPNGGNPYAVL